MLPMMPDDNPNKAKYQERIDKALKQLVDYLMSVSLDANKKATGTDSTAKLVPCAWCCV